MSARCLKGIGAVAGPVIHIDLIRTDSLALVGRQHALHQTLEAMRVSRLEDAVAGKPLEHVALPTYAPFHRVVIDSKHARALGSLRRSVHRSHSHCDGHRQRRLVWAQRTGARLVNRLTDAMGGLLVQPCACLGQLGLLHDDRHNTGNQPPRVRAGLLVAFDIDQQNVPMASVAGFDADLADALSVNGKGRAILTGVVTCCKTKECKLLILNDLVALTGIEPVFKP